MSAPEPGAPAPATLHSASAGAPAATTAAGEREIALDQLHAGRYSMRLVIAHDTLSELAESMSRVGLINAVTVRGRGGEYDLVAGHRRCAAAELLGWRTIRARVIEADPLATAAMSWHENSARQDVTPLDRAAWVMQQMRETGASQTTMSRLLGVSQAHMSELLATLEYPEQLKDALRAGAVSFSVAREIYRMQDPAAVEYYTRQAAEYGATVATAKEWIRNWRASQVPEPTPAPAAAADGHAPEESIMHFTHTCAACHAPAQQITYVLLCSTCANLVTSPEK